MSDILEQKKKIIKKKKQKIIQLPLKKKFILHTEKLFLGSVILMFFIFASIIATMSIQQSFEREKWYRSHYYIIEKIETIILDTSARKKAFQLKIAGFLKEHKSNLNDDEIVNFTNYIFDKSMEYGWDPYLPVAISFTESRFDKLALGKNNDKGLYQFLPVTARIIAKLAGMEYYYNMEYNVLDSTKLWFAYMKILVDTFNGDISCALLAYNAGEGSVIKRCEFNLDNNNNYIIDYTKLTKFRKIVYYDNKRKAYDEEVLKNMSYIKFNILKGETK